MSLSLNMSFFNYTSTHSKPTSEIFTSQQILRLAQSSGCDLISPIDFSVSRESRAHVIDMLRDDLAQLPHINLKIHAALFSSVCVVLRKPFGIEHRELSQSLRLDAIDRAVVLSNQVRVEDLVAPRGRMLRTVDWVQRKFRGLRYKLEERFLYEK